MNEESQTKKADFFRVDEEPIGVYPIEAQDEEGGEQLGSLVVYFNYREFQIILEVDVDQKSFSENRYYDCHDQWRENEDLNRYFDVPRIKFQNSTVFCVMQHRDVTQKNPDEEDKPFFTSEEEKQDFAYCAFSKHERWAIWESIYKFI